MSRIANLVLAQALLVILPAVQIAQAQTQSPPSRAAVPAATAQPRLTGQTFEGKPFDLASLRGKVVMVVFWSTTCAVCRDKMGELRVNYEGWRGQPFEMVLVNQDRRLKDVQDYEQIIALTVPRAQRFPQLWNGQPGYGDSFGAQSVLPATYIINKSGTVAKAYAGRIPPEAWDDIADLL